MDFLSPEALKKVLELMSEPAEVERMLQRTDLDLAHYGQKRSNAELMRLHEKYRADLAMGLTSSGFTTRFTNPHAETKPFGPPRIPSELTPIHVSALAVGVTHRGRALRATIVGLPAISVGVMLLLEDDRRDYVKLAVYNRVRTQAEADALFVLGRRLLVVEPFFKLFADGTHGIRCDNPNEVLLMSAGASPPATAQQGGGAAAAEALRAEGNRHFASLEFDEAVESYSAGLHALDHEDASGRLLCLLTLNASACYLKLDEPLRALEAASTALALLASSGRSAPQRPELGKAHVRAGLALAALSEPRAARSAMLEAARVTGAADGGAKLLAQIGETPAPKAASAASSASSAAQPEADGWLGLLLRALLASGNLCAPAPLGAAEPLPPTRSGQLERASLARESKERGNALFVAGSTAEALVCYQTALRELGTAPIAATLLANRAAAYLRIGAAPALCALRDARAALAIDRHSPQPKAVHRVVLALVALDWLPEAEAACEEALRVLEETQAGTFLELRAKIAARREAAHGQQSSSARMPVRERLRQRMASAGERPTDDAHTQMMENMRIAISLAKRTGQVGSEKEMLLFGDSLFDERVPSFHKDFARAGLMPKQCDVSRCLAKLHSAYEHAASSKMHEAVIVSLSGPTSKSPGSTPQKGSSSTSLPFGDKTFITREDLGKRLRSNDEAAFRWFCCAEEGDVRTAIVRPYEEDLHHSFSNSALAATVMAAGHTHVGVGFVDLGVLSASIAISGYSEASTAQPTLWIERSSYAVAKTAAIVAMMQRGSSDDDVLQVWYSSAWSMGARTSFRAALGDLLSPSCKGVTGGLDCGAIPPSVLAFLRQWALADVSLSAARKGWLDSHDSQTFMHIANFVRECDRHALCSYMLTGQLLLAQVGSAVMFGTPDELGLVSPDESFLQTIAPSEVAQGLASAQGDVVESCVRIARGRISALSREIRRGAVLVRLRLATLTPEARVLHAEISELQPHTINWSNVPDYSSPKAFHSMARACSAPEDTVHVMHTMNWPLYTCGSSHLDIAVRLFKEPEMLKSCFRDMVAAAHETINMIYGLEGWDKVLLTPPITNIRNVLDLACLYRTYRSWADAFLGHGAFVNKHQWSVQSMPIFSVMSRSDSTFVLGFSYDPTVQIVQTTEE